MPEPAEALDANYVLTLEEIGNLAGESVKPAETLMRVVALIATRFNTDVCSIYLLEPDRANLVLAATVGLRSECIGTLRMRLDEGLAGLVAEKVRPVAVGQVASHPRFKYFGEAGEDSYQSFLGVPIIERGVLQGVLVLQTVQGENFPGGRNPDANPGCGAGGSGRQRSPHSRSLYRAGAGKALGPSSQSVVELGSGFHNFVPRPGPRALAGTQSQSHITALRDPAVEAGAPRGRARAARPYQLRVSALAGIPQIGPDVGRDPSGRVAAAAGGLFFSGVRPARVVTDLFRRLGRAGRRSH